MIQISPLKTLAIVFGGLIIISSFDFSLSLLLVEEEEASSADSFFVVLLRRKEKNLPKIGILELAAAQTEGTTSGQSSNFWNDLNHLKNLEFKSVLKPPKS